MSASWQICQRCRGRGKTWAGGDPKCGFLTGDFDPSNWNCATLNELREMCGEDSFLNLESSVFTDRVGDSSIGVLPGPDDSFIVLSWYKRRGRTSRALYISDDEVHELTLAEAESALTLNAKNISPIS